MTNRETESVSTNDAPATVEGIPVSELGQVGEYLYKTILEAREKLGKLEVDTIQTRGIHEASVVKLQELIADFNSKMTVEDTEN